jgi:hypothetical protein
MWVSRTYQATTAASQLNFGFNTIIFFRTFLITTRVLTFDANDNVTTTERTIRMGDRLHPTVFFHETLHTDTEPKNSDTAFCLHSYTFSMHPKAFSSLFAGPFYPGVSIHWIGESDKLLTEALNCLVCKFLGHKDIR